MSAQLSCHISVAAASHVCANELWDEKFHSVLGKVFCKEEVLAVIPTLSLELSEFLELVMHCRQSDVLVLVTATWSKGLLAFF